MYLTYGWIGYIHNYFELKTTSKKPAILGTNNAH